MCRFLIQNLHARLVTNLKPFNIALQKNTSSASKQIYPYHSHYGMYALYPIKPPHIPSRYVEDP